MTCLSSCLVWSWQLNDAVMAELLMEAPGLQSLPERRGAIRLAADSKDSRDLLLLLEVRPGGGGGQVQWREEECGSREAVAQDTHSDMAETVAACLHANTYCAFLC